MRVVGHRARRAGCDRGRLRRGRGDGLCAHRRGANCVRSQHWKRRNAFRALRRLDRLCARDAGADRPHCNGRPAGARSPVLHAAEALRDQPGRGTAVGVRGVDRGDGHDCPRRLDGARAPLRGTLDSDACARLRRGGGAAAHARDCSCARRAADTEGSGGKCGGRQCSGRQWRGGRCAHEQSDGSSARGQGRRY